MQHVTSVCRIFLGLIGLYVNRFIEHQEYPDWVFTDEQVWERISMRK